MGGATNQLGRGMAKAMHSREQPMRE
jgi:hypothetical protein